MWYVYVLRDSGTRRLYVGVTADLRKRYHEHLNGKTKTTSRMKGLLLIYYECCLNKRDAEDRERQLKTGFGRAYLKRRLKHYLRP